MMMAMGMVADDGKGPPGAVEHGIDHGDGEAGQGEDEDKQDGHRSDDAGALADFIFGNLGQTLTLDAGPRRRAPPCRARPRPERRR